MRTIIKIVGVFVVLITSMFGRLLTAQAALMVIDCNYYSQNHINGNVFLNYERTDYQNGLLSFHFTFDPQGTVRTINTTLRLQEPENCSNATNPLTQKSLQFPQTLNNFSVRFTANNSYQFYDDDTGTPVDCLGCSAQFSLPTSPQGPYKAQFDLFTNNLESIFSSTSQFIHVASSPARTPVLIIPGITGTELQKGADLLWPNIGRMILDIGDSFMDPLAFQQDLTPLDTSIVTGPVVGNPLNSFDYTEGLINQFIDAGYRKDVDLFTFPYDWRFSVKKDADLLKDKITEIINQTHSDKVDIVAHSTGGLIVKNYIMTNSAPKIDKVVFVGSPNLGAPKAIKTLIQGDNLGIPGLSDSEIKKIAHNMPAIYDLAPSSNYIEKNGGYLAVNVRNLFNSTTQDLNYDQTKSYLFNNKGLNSLAMAQSEQLHSPDFDNFDVRSKGVDAYNIVGCNTGTLGKIIERKTSPPLPFINGYALQYVPGDGTVPLGSAGNIVTDANKTFFATNIEHAKMLGSNGTRQLIAKIISGHSSIDVGDNISNGNSQCKLNGKVLGIFSPVNIEVTDLDGHKAGLLSDGSVSNTIPNAQFDLMDDHKFVYLPENDGQSYTVNLTGTDSGTFSIEAATIRDNNISSTSFYRNLPVTANSRGYLTAEGDTTLTFDNIVHKPDVVLSPEQMADITPPELLIQFDPVAKDLVFIGQDNLPGKVTVNDQSDSIIATDQTGNALELQLTQKDHQQHASVEVARLLYNGTLTNSTKNKLKIQWYVDKFGHLKSLSQIAKNRKNYHIQAEYDGLDTVITGKGQQGNINQRLKGLVLLSVQTKAGDLEWKLTPF